MKIKEMTNIIVQYKNEKKTLRINKKGFLLFKSLQKHFPKAKGLIYYDRRGKPHTLTVSSGGILINSKVNEYDLYIDEVTANSPINGYNQVNFPSLLKTSLDDELQSNLKSKSRNQIKTLRVGWLHKSPTEKKYCKLKKPLNGIIKLKLDQAIAYTANEIKIMAVKEFESKENFVMNDNFTIEIGFFGGSIIHDFSLGNDTVCDIWNYCQYKKISLYNLNIYLLTELKNSEQDPFECLKSIKDQKSSSNGITKKTKITTTTKKKSKQKKPPRKDDYRVYYHYTKTSKYSQQISSSECEKKDLHSYHIEDNFGDGPFLEDFDPYEHGYSFSKIEKRENVYFQISIDEDRKRSFDFPLTKEPVDKHSIIHDTDELQGIYDAKFGIGVVPSCTDECRPIFEWYKDDEVYKKGEFLYWLSDIEKSKDKEKHIWHCIIKCQESNRELRSKEVAWTTSEQYQ